MGKRKSSNERDKLAQLMLYMMPKYIDRIEKEGFLGTNYIGNESLFNDINGNNKKNSEPGSSPTKNDGKKDAARDDKNKAAGKTDLAKGDNKAKAADSKPQGGSSSAKASDGKSQGGGSSAKASDGKSQGGSSGAKASDVKPQGGSSSAKASDVKPQGGSSSARASDGKSQGGGSSTKASDVKSQGGSSSAGTLNGRSPIGDTKQSGSSSNVQESNIKSSTPDDKEKVGELKSSENALKSDVENIGKEGENGIMENNLKDDAVKSNIDDSIIKDDKDKYTDEDKNLKGNQNELFNNDNKLSEEEKPAVNNITQNNDNKSAAEDLNIKNNEDPQSMNSNINNESLVNLYSNRCNNCIRVMRTILIQLINEKVSISIKMSDRGIINNATLIEVQDSIIILKSERKNLILVPICEIVGIKSYKISSVDFVQNCYNIEEDYCSKEQNLRKYFNSNIGRRLLIQTKGDGDFKYIYNKPIINVGKGFIIIENDIIICICNIISVEELDKRSY